MHKTIKNVKHNIKNFDRSIFKRPQFLVFVLGFAFIGTLILYQSYAAGNFLKVEAEAVAPVGNATRVPAANASGTGNNVVQFGSASSATPVRYEAESAAHDSASTVEAKSGGTVLGSFGHQGQFVTFTVNVPIAGNYAAVLRYAAADGSSTHLNPLPRTLLINNVQVRTINFPRTSEGLDQWDTLTVMSIDTLALNSGSNTVTFRIDTAQEGYWDVDYLEVAGASGGVNPNPPGPEPQPPNPLPPTPPPTGGSYGLPAVNTTNAVRVSNDSQLTSAINNAGSGTVIILSGSFGDISLNGKNGGSGWITITGDPAGGRVSTGRVDFWNASNIELRHLSINATKASNNVFGKTVQVRGSNYIRVWDNEIFNGEEGGFSAPGDDGQGAHPSDHLDLRYNDVHNNAKNGIDCCQGSGITILQPGANGGPDSDGYSIRIIGNRVWDNIIGNTGASDVTDGNGIILDNFFYRNYPNRTLIANNIVSGNGGVGIGLTRSSHAVLVNNTLYYNHTDHRASVYNNGEILCNGWYSDDCTDNIMFNNIVWPNPSYPGDIMEPFSSGYTNGGKGVYFQNNLVVRSGWNSYGLAAVNSVVGNGGLISPQEGNLAAGDWRPSSGSPAIGTGVSSYRNFPAPNIDLSGKTRPGAPAMGALEP